MPYHRRAEKGSASTLLLVPQRTVKQADALVLLRVRFAPCLGLVYLCTQITKLFIAHTLTDRS